MLRNLGTLVLLLLLATPLAAVAQQTGKLAGRVTDDLGDPLPGANVIIEGTQLGTATDLEGNYFIIGVPVGQYDVTASFVGYQPVTIEDVQISSGYTTQQSFELTQGELLDEIVVEYERPIIQRDAIGVPKVVTGEQIENLPVRGVANVAAIQAGVVSNDGSNNLFIRGGREQEVAYYVDGVKVASGNLAVNQQAIAEQEMLIGTIPARYGDVMSGVISITTKSGGNEFFGSFEAITSEVLDDYGFNVGSLNIGGPIIPGKASFFASISGTSIGDSSPFGVSTFQLSDGTLADLQQNPQAFRIRCVADCGDETTGFATVPSESLAGASVEDVLDDPEAFGVVLPDEGSWVIDSATPVSRAETFTEAQFEEVEGKDNAFEALTFNGSLTFNPIAEISLRLGGAFEVSRDESFNFGRQLYARNRFYLDDEQTYRIYGTFRQRLGGAAFYQIQAEYQDFSEEFYPNTFSGDIEDVFFYGDADHPANAFGTNRLLPGVDDAGDLVFAPQAVDGSLSTWNESTYGLFSGPGTALSFYRQQHNTQLRFSGLATLQLGLHQIEFGAEYEQQTRRLFDGFFSTLARYYNDGDVEAGEGYDAYSQIPYEVFDSAVASYSYYGYNYNGLEEVGDQDLDAFISAVRGQTENPADSDFNVAPHEPIYYAGYIQDKIEYRDLVINLGLRVDVFDNNTLVLRDVFAPFPIVRAGDLVTSSSDFYVDGFSLPGGVDEDYAVYFRNPSDLSSVVGFRDLDGNFFALVEGGGVEAATSTDVKRDLGGKIKLVAGEQISAEMFEDYEPQVTVMPRIGVSFPVTDRALFFASYNVTSQRPSERAFASIASYAGLATGTSFNNPALEPETTTQYELGFRQRVGERAALTLSGFYRTQENKIALRGIDQIGGDYGYRTFLNADFATSKGVEVGFDLRRTGNVAINANYTLSFADGTGSDAASAAAIAWVGSFYPNFIFPTDFDRRHTLNLSVDYRFGEGEGPEIGGVQPLANFGINVLGTFKSGQPYTPISNFADITNNVTPSVEGAINNTYMPGVTLIDLEIDRRFDLGFASLKAYVNVLNVLDSEGILNVYRATGDVDESGFLETSAGQAFVNNALLPESALFQYNALQGGPIYAGNNGFVTSGSTFYVQPRRIRLGILVNF